MKISIEKFSGLAPRYSPELLNNEFAVVAENLSIKSGKIHPERKFHFSKPDRDYVPGQINDDQYNRIYSIDAERNLVVHGFFPDGSGEISDKISERSADMPHPEAPVLTQRESKVFSDILGDGEGTMYFQYGSKLAAGDDEGRRLLYAERILPPLTGWKDTGNGWSRDYSFRNKNITEWGLNGAGPFYEVNSCSYVMNNGRELVFNGIEYTTRINSQRVTNHRGEEVGTVRFYHRDIAVEKQATSPGIETWLDSILNGKDEGEGGDVTTGGRYSGTAVVYPAKDLRMFVEVNYIDITRNFYYVARFVDDSGAEGPPSELSELMERKPDERLNITVSFDASVAASYRMKKIRLYRSAGGTDGSDYFYLGEREITAGASSVVFQDDMPDSELSEPMPEYGNSPKLDGIAALTGGFMAGFEGKNIWFSEPYLPHVWPSKYNQSVQFDVIGIAVRSNYLYVMTKGQLYAFVGDAPEQMTPLTLRFDMPCISRTSIAYVSGSIVYAGTTGLVVISNEGPRIFSNAYFTTEQYKALGFENCLAAGEYDGKYFAVFERETLLFDFVENTLTTLNQAGFELLEYRADDGSWPQKEFLNSPYGSVLVEQIFEQEPEEEKQAAPEETGPEELTARWHSKTYVFPRPVAFSTVRIRSYGEAEHSVILRLFAENVMVKELKIKPGKAVRLPLLRRERRWSFELETDCDLEAFEIAESMAEL